MQVEGVPQLLRVRAVAEMFDVSPATIYRAIESGALRAVRFGTGRGALRVPVAAVEVFLAGQQVAQSGTGTDQAGVVA